jgi:hypothetical protein
MVQNAALNFQYEGDLLFIKEVSPEGTGQPLLMEFARAAEKEPCLVTNTTGVLWAPLWKPPHQMKVRAAFSSKAQPALFQEAVDAIWLKALQEDWGSVHPVTATGFVQAVGHLRDAGIQQVAVLCHPEFTWSELPRPQAMPQEGEGPEQRYLLGMPVENAPWLNPYMLVLVPQDRNILGRALSVGEQTLMYFHQARRAIAICRG